MKSIVRLAAVSAIFAMFIGPSAILADEPSSTEEQEQKLQTPKNPKVPFTISKETTYLTEPLTPDGYVDYVAAINKMCSEGVTAENNAVVLLLEAVGPNFIHVPNRQKYFQMLGVAPLPEKGDYLISYEAYLTENQSKRENIDETQAAQDRVHKQKEPELYVQWLKANQKPLEKILGAVKRPKFYAPLISAEGDAFPPMIGVLLDAIQQSRACAQLLMVHALYSIGEGKIEDARRDILACHRLARLVGQGTTLVEYLVAIAIDGMACQGEVTLAQSGILTAREAADFREELKKLPPMPKIADKIDKAERFMLLDCVATAAKKGPDSLAHLVDISGQKDDPLQKFYATDIPSDFDWDAVLRLGNHWYDRMVEAGRKPTRAQRADAWKQIDNEIKKLFVESKSMKSIDNSQRADEPVHTIRGKNLGGILLGLLVPALGEAGKAEEKNYVYSDLSQIALAMAAYHSDNGRYPDRLADLAPKYLSELPKDRFADADYIYQREGNGYLLYSVGANGKDDGGKSHYDSPPDEEGDDLVIRTPTEAK